MKKRIRCAPKISLNGEGILLECTESFIGRRASVTREDFISIDRANLHITGASPRGFAGIPNGYITVEKGDFLLFLGCRHSQSKLREGMSMMISDGRGIPTEVLREELFSPEWYTSLLLLHKEQIVKVDWHGEYGLDQLHEAASFLYSNFSRILTTTTTDSEDQ